ncbi:MAG: glutamate ABC transporter substrate-binding protein [Nostocoides sp.]
MNAHRSAAVRATLIAVAGALLAACAGTGATEVPTITTPSVDIPTAAPAQTCAKPTASYAPSGPLPAAASLPSGSTMAKIRQRGRLIAGVSADTYLLGSRNPLTGAIEGFDIDLVHQIAEAILGPKAKVELRVITAADRIPVLQEHEVDIVVRNMTITCDRWEKIAFSAEYYHSGQKLLVRKGSPITSFDSIGTATVCAPLGTSSLANLVRLAPTASIVPASTHTGCLVALQEGRAEAITGDDTVLAGLAAQDPYAVVLAGAPVTNEPYGVGVAKDQIDLVRFVNAVLETMRADGSWAESYATWLAPTLGKSPGQPTPVYGRAP